MREEDMLVPLKTWLKRTRRVRDDTLLVPEFSWMGRWVDLATLTMSGSSTAYELKLYKNLDAMEQAVKNSLAFDRSYIVTATRPSCKNLDIAAQLGIGVITLSNGIVNVAVHAQQMQHPPNVARKLRQSIRDKVVN